MGACIHTRAHTHTHMRLCSEVLLGTDGGSIYELSIDEARHERVKQVYSLYEGTGLIAGLSQVALEGARRLVLLLCGTRLHVFVGGPSSEALFGAYADGGWHGRAGVSPSLPPFPTGAHLDLTVTASCAPHHEMRSCWEREGPVCCSAKCQSTMRARAQTNCIQTINGEGPCMPLCMSVGFEASALLTPCGCVCWCSGIGTTEPKYVDLPIEHGAAQLQVLTPPQPPEGKSYTMPQPQVGMEMGIGIEMGMGWG
jgi:hypothetical protein